MKKIILTLGMIIFGTGLSVSFFEKSLHVKPVDNQPNWFLWLYLLGMIFIMVGLILGTRELINYLSQKTDFPFHTSLPYFILGMITLGLTYNGLMKVELLNFLIDPYFLMFLFGLAMLALALVSLIIELFSLYKKTQTKE
ncbi:hypothetical protein JNUCC83_04175 [Vagococcus sp. JNUCC 83]